MSFCCDKSCKEIKQTTINQLDLIEKAIEREEKIWNGVTKHLENGAKVLTEFEKFVLEYDKATNVGEDHKQQVLDDMSDAHKKGYLDEDQYNQMKDQVKNAKANNFNPELNLAKIQLFTYISLVYLQKIA